MNRTFDDCEVIVVKLIKSQKIASIVELLFLLWTTLTMILSFFVNGLLANFIVILLSFSAIFYYLLYRKNHKEIIFISEEEAIRFLAHRKKWENIKRVN